MSFSVNILHDIKCLFYCIVYVDYLVFLRRLKHGGPWLDKLSLSTQRHLCPRRENKAVGLREKLALGEVRVPLVLEVVGEDPRRSKLIGFC
jgi:hypothetical protein